MKKILFAVFMFALLVFSIQFFSTKQLGAAVDKPILDGSLLIFEKESVGYDTKITRGEDLLTGYSKIVRLGPGKIYAGGTTIAAHDVETIRVSVLVERAQEGDTTWSTYDGWYKKSENTDRVGSNRTLEVEGGYYYRVRCTHSANDDVSSSFTNGVYVEEP